MQGFLIEGRLQAYLAQVNRTSCARGHPRGLPTMLVPYPDLAAYRRPTPQHVDWLLSKGVRTSALIGPPMVLVAPGVRAPDGAFEDDPAGEDWLLFPEAEDVVYWQLRSGKLARWNRRAFAIGEDSIHAAATYSFDACLNVFADPVQWLRAGRDGIVIVDWSQTFDRLRDVPRIAVAQSLLDKLKHHLQPPRRPEIFVMRQREAVA
ncbi:hypothetical protein GOA64_23370 [Sinorhizobium meliloti]|nr:hypothetical protein [Sinorhizobium meliloti]